MVQKGIEIMKNQITGKITGAINKASMFTGACLTTGLMMLENAMAAGGFSGYANAPDGTKVVNGAKSFLGTAGTFIGAIWVIAAIFTLVMAIRNEDNEGRNKALLNVVCGGVLCSLSLIFALFFGK